MDPYMVVKDFEAYRRMHQQVEKVITRIPNSGGPKVDNINNADIPAI